MTRANDRGDATGDPRPWEQLGAVRRDCEPHRGWPLCGLGVLSTGLALVGLVGLASTGLVYLSRSTPLPSGLARDVMLLAAVAVAASLAGATAGSVAWAITRRDLAAIAAGRMDPEGERWLRRGHLLAQIGLVLGGAGAVYAALDFLPRLF